MNEDELQNQNPQQAGQVVDTTTPPSAATQQTQQTPGEFQDAMDYRDLLSSQIMAEQARANASKYVMGGLQSSGVAQTGVAQSILSGIQSSYQNTLAQNVNQYMMLQQERQVGELSAAQQNAMNTATTLLQEPGLTQEEYDYIYETYYNQMSPQDQQTFKFLYDRIGRQYGFGEGSTETGTVSNEISDYLYTNYNVTSENITPFDDSNYTDAFVLEDAFNSNFAGDAYTNRKLVTSDGKLDLTKFNDEDAFQRYAVAVSRNNVPDGTVISLEFDVRSKTGRNNVSVYYHFVVYKGKMYRIPQESALNKVNKKFKFTNNLGVLG